MQAGTPLRAGALRLTAIVMQGVTHIGPTTGIILVFPYITSLAGLTSPLAFLFALLIVLLLGISLTQLARHLPSAGGYYTYVSRTIHPRAGFITAWMFFLYEPIGVAPTLAYLGYIFETTIKSTYGVDIPWWIVFAICVAALFAISYYGIRLSVGTALVLGLLEMVILLALAGSVVAHPGRGGVTLSPFNPANSLSANGLYLAVVFNIFSFAGFESIAPLAEETAEPRRLVPRAIIYSLLIGGVFYVLVSWAYLVGWGTANLKGFLSASDNPVFILARHAWGGAWIVVFLALLNSLFAIAIAGNNAATRTLYGVARSGLLPAALARVHPRHRTPVNIVFLEMALTLVLGLAVGTALRPDNYFFFNALLLTFALIFIYILGNLGVFLFYSRERRAEFNPLLHVVFPLASTAALVWVAYNSVSPLPAPPLRYAPWVNLIWLVLGIVLVGALAATGHERWLRTAGQVMEEESRADPAPPRR